MSWLKTTNATVSDVLCAAPEDLKDKRLNDMNSLHDECVSTGERLVSDWLRTYQLEALVTRFHLRLLVKS